MQKTKVQKKKALPLVNVYNPGNKLSLCVSASFKSVSNNVLVYRLYWLNFLYNTNEVLLKLGHF